MKEELKDMLKALIYGVFGILILILFVVVLVGGGALALNGLRVWFEFIGM